MKFIDDSRIPDQPYPELRGVLDAFATEVSVELADNLVGMYMLGSLAVGDFDLDSDVDFLVVTKTDITEPTSKRLQAIQEKIYSMDCYPAHHLEGSFICMDDLNDWSFVGKKELYYFDNGSTEIEKSVHDNQWHVRWILRERGVTLVGPKPVEFIKAVPTEELRNEMKRAMVEVMMSFEAEIINPRCYWNSRFGQPFAVLTFCRMLQTLQTGKVESKKSAAKWAKGMVDAKWHKVVDDALIEREGVRHMVKIKQRAEQSMLEETLGFMKYITSLNVMRKG
jgi:predicted nucleotidyltransferase